MHRNQVASADKDQGAGLTEYRVMRALCTERRPLLKACGTVKVEHKPCRESPSHAMLGLLCLRVKPFPGKGVMPRPLMSTSKKYVTVTKSRSLRFKLQSPYPVLVCDFFRMTFKSESLSETTKQFRFEDFAVLRSSTSDSVMHGRLQPGDATTHTVKSHGKRRRTRYPSRSSFENSKKT